MKKLKKIITGVADLNRVQDNSDLALKSLRTVALLNGVLVKDFALVSGKVNNVPHGLQRNIQGWQVVDSTAQSTIWRDATVTLPTGLLALRCSANTTISLWVF